MPLVPQPGLVLPKMRVHSPHALECEFYCLSLKLQVCIEGIGGTGRLQYSFRYCVRQWHPQPCDTRERKRERRREEGTEENSKTLLDKTSDLRFAHTIAGTGGVLQEGEVLKIPAAS